MKLDAVISGERLRLRSYAPEDLAFVSSLWFDPENGKYLSDPEWPALDSRFRAALDGLADSPYGYYLVAERKDTGERIGTCCAFPDETGSACEIGYCVQKQHWRRGYGSEILAVLEAWIFGRGAREIRAEVAAENAASIALLQKRGFAVEREAEFQKYNRGITYKSYVCCKRAQ